MQTYDVTITKDNGRTATIEVEADTLIQAEDKALESFQWRFGYVPTERGMVIRPGGAV